MMLSASLLTMTSQGLIPPNSPAQIELNGRMISVEYAGKLILQGQVGGDVDAPLKRTVIKRGPADAIDQAWILTARKGTREIHAVIEASTEAFACAVERPDQAEPSIVRNQVGPVVNALNRAVYDRRGDWVLSFDPHSRVEIVPGEATADKRTFQVTARGDELILRFRPRYYQKHRGLARFQPWTYQVWPKPVVGWCSWFAYFTDVDEAKMLRAVEALSSQLSPYGLQYVQIDDGYQRTPVAFSDTWLKPNAKFPSGLDGLVRSIHARGLKAGVWSSTMFHDDNLAAANPDVFVTDQDGKPAWGRWVGYSVDGSNPKAIDRLTRPIYRGFVEQGWDYFKVDALRHLRYEGYNSNAAYFDRKKIDRSDAYRRVVQAIRDEIGPTRFMLACWGIRPELIGLADGCRIGDDGFAYAGLAQFNSFNNVVWRNDPDHIELSPAEGYRSCLVTTLCGALYMLTDKAENYDRMDLEPARRTMPTPITRPAQLYDVDPTRSDHLASVDTELSGSGPRPFDASRRATCDLFQLDIAKPFGQWTVLGRTGESVKSITFGDLGLPGGKRQHVFEFWSKRYLGSFERAFTPGAIDSRFNCQAFVIRADEGRPQLLATGRHVTGGEADVQNLEWVGPKSLRGTCLGMKEEPYVVYLHEPTDWTLDKVEASGARLVSNEAANGVRTLKFRLDESRTFTWTATYR